MALATALEAADLSQIVEDSGLVRLNGSRDVSSRGANSNYIIDTAKGRFIVKLHEPHREAEVKREIDLLGFLRKHGFPCPEPVPDRRGRPLREWNGRCLTIYRYIDGHSLTQKHEAAQIENAGKTLATLHGIGKAYKKGIENRFNFDRVTDIYCEVRTRLPSYFKTIVRTLDDEGGYLKHYLEQKLPKGVIHGDLFPEHLVFKGPKVVGVLNFQAAGRGKFIYDMATAVNALCFDGKAYSLDKFEAFVAGYEGLRTLSLGEWDAFPNELRFSAFRFTVTRLRDFFDRPAEERRRSDQDFRAPFECLRVLRRERDGGMEGLLMAMATGYDYRKYQRVKALERKGGR